MKWTLTKTLTDASVVMAFEVEAVELNEDLELRPDLLDRSPQPPAYQDPQARLHRPRRFGDAGLDNAFEDLLEIAGVEVDGDDHRVPVRRWRSGK